MVVIVDYKIGNLGSVLNMLKRLGVRAKISSDPAEIRQAEKLILPGVGAFERGMTNLNAMGLVPLLREAVLERGKPLLGICLGMQLLTRGSEEGDAAGLGWIEGETIRFRVDQHSWLKIPHMGWNSVSPTRTDTLFRGLDEDSAFYFAHSYHVVCEAKEDILATCNHGYEFVCSVQKGNIFGIQFHPEKSHKFGLTLLKNFAQLA